MNEARRASPMLLRVSPIAEYFLLAVASIFWPLLITIVVLVLRTSHPVKLLSAFLAGGLLATISVGCALVFSFDGSGPLTSDRADVDPAVNITVGILAILLAVVVLRLDAGPHEPKAPAQGSGRADRYLANARLAFVAGLLLNLVPGLFPFVALKDIAEGGYSAGVEVALVALFYVIMFASVEIPLVSYLAAPTRTVDTVQRLNVWLDRNTKRVGAGVLGAVGVYLVTRGILQL
jgi:hypothetical protein